MTKADTPTNYSGKKNVKNKSPKLTIVGLILVLLFMGGFLWFLNKNSESVENIQKTNFPLEENRTKGEAQTDGTQQILEITKSGEFQTITLLGNQAVAPQALAKIYFNKKENLAYIDITGLPDPPSGKAFQLWSLKMEPFVSTDLGMIESKDKIGEKIYELPNFTKSGTLCITLEPVEGSKTPTMSQIYVLEMVPEN